jgi:hypothetical protein
LDGRLPSGRRAKVISHSESCATCGSFWLELQAAQKLTMSLQETEVGSNFRDGLWGRINAGEGTPSAVFQEQVPLWSKVRYALTGAAAAAALLIGVTFLTKDEVVTSSTTDLASIDNDANSNNGTLHDLAPDGAMTVNLASADGQSTLEPRRRQYQIIQPPLMAAAKPLSTQVLAVETARQLEERYATAAVGLRMMQQPESNRAAWVTQVVDSAREMRDFGELLIDLRDRQGLVFTDASIDADLQFAVAMLEKVSTKSTPNEQMVKLIIEPVLTKSGRLAHVSRAIRFKPTTNIHTEHSYLQSVNTMRPEVFRKLFVVLGTPNQMRPKTIFLLQGDCELDWVAPISEIKRLKIK